LEDALAGGVEVVAVDEGNGGIHLLGPPVGEPQQFPN
jgi:hypothetical protein